MRILLANKFYYPRGGDCVCTLNLEQLLQEHGHEVAVFAMQHPENLSTSWSKYFPSEINFSPGRGMFETLRRPFGSKEVRKKFSALLDDFQPDVVHLNNIHTQLSPVIAQIAHQRGIRVVWTLHDYKLLCSRSDCLLNDIECCEKCYGSRKHTFKYRCMKQSLSGSLIGQWEARYWSKEKLENITDAFICPSQFMKQQMQKGGFSANKLIPLSNFMDSSKIRRTHFVKENYYCYVGRLSREKGLETLIRAANSSPHRLKIIGTGDMLPSLQKQAASHIEFSGRKNWEEIEEIMGKARLSIISSEWYENNPLSVIESLCLGTPVIGSQIGGIPELITPYTCCATYKPGDADSLREVIQKMFTTEFSSVESQDLAENAGKRFSASLYYHQLMNIYKNENNSQ